MYSFGLVCLALCALAPMLAEGASYAETTGHLNLTAIAAHDGRSSLECWQLTDSLISAPGPGGIAKTLMTELGPAGNVSWTVAPARTDLGLHNAASVLYFAFISGLAHIRIPNSTQEAWVLGGKSGVILATDVASVSKLGHDTVHPSDEPTVGLIVPTKDGKIPDHLVLHGGPCVGDELAP